MRRSSWDSNPPSPLMGKRPKVERNEPSDVYGVHLLAYLSSEIQQRVRSRLVIPIAVLAGKTDVSFVRPSAYLTMPNVWQLLAEPTRMSRFLDAGAIDVLPSPLGVDRVQGLAVHAYRTYKEVSREAASFVLQKRNRKLSWVGIDEERPYAYLREVMVSGLMNGICNPDSVGEFIDPKLVPRISAYSIVLLTWMSSANSRLNPKEKLSWLKLWALGSSLPMTSTRTSSFTLH